MTSQRPESPPVGGSIPHTPGAWQANRDATDRARALCSAVRANAPTASRRDALLGDFAAACREDALPGQPIASKKTQWADVERARDRWARAWPVASPAVMTYFPCPTDVSPHPFRNPMASRQRADSLPHTPATSPATQRAQYFTPRLEALGAWQTLTLQQSIPFGPGFLRIDPEGLHLTGLR